MSLREAAQQALEALNHVAGAMPFPMALQVRDALRERLAQPEQMVVSPECAERGCMAHDDRVDGPGVVVPVEQEPVAWRNAALRVGEDLSSVGPDGYYDMTAEQWLDWAMDQEPRGKTSLNAPRQSSINAELVEALRAIAAMSPYSNDVMDAIVLADGALAKVEASNGS